MTTVNISSPEDRTRIQSRALDKITIPEETECWEWTAYVDDDTRYGRMRVGDTIRDAHRIMYEHFTIGGIPEDCEELRHRCPAMSNSCCNPHYVVPGTVSQNQIDAIIDGGRDVEFTAHEIGGIRQRYRDETITQGELGDEFGVSQRMISGIVRRETYDHVPPVGA